MADTVKFSLLKRRPDLDHAQFAAHWRGTHARVLVEAGHADYNADYVQNLFGAAAGHDADLLFDGAAQMRQKQADVRAGFQEDPRYLAFVRPDEEQFMDVAASLVLFTQAETRKAGADSTVKLMVFAAWTAQADAAAVRDWQGTVLASASGVPVQSCTHYHVLAGGARGLATTDFDVRNAPARQFDIVLEYGLPSVAALGPLLAHITSHWPPSIGRDHAFILRSDPRRIY